MRDKHYYLRELREKKARGLGLTLPQYKRFLGKRQLDQLIC